MHAKKGAEGGRDSQMKIVKGKLTAFSLTTGFSVTSSADEDTDRGRLDFLL